MAKPFADKIQDFFMSNPYSARKRTLANSIARSNIDVSLGSILSANCLAGEMYSILGTPFLTPTINCSMDRNDFVDFAVNLKTYISGFMRPCNLDSGVLKTELIPADEALNSIIIEWPHDTDSAEVIANWEKRKVRIEYDNLTLLCDTNSLSEEKAIEFNNIKWARKGLITTSNHAFRNLECSIPISTYSGKKIGKFQYRKPNGLYEFEELWDWIDWLNQGGCKDEK